VKLWAQGKPTYQRQKGTCIAPQPIKGQPYNWFSKYLSTVSLREIAETVAPALWLSPNEPVLPPEDPDPAAKIDLTKEIDPAKDYPLPRNFATDKDACKDQKSQFCRIVYWKPVRIAVSCHRAKVCKDSLETIAKTSAQWNQPLSSLFSDFRHTLHRVDFEYYFYYPNEVGLGHHVHDFETSLVQVNVCDQGDMLHFQGAKAGGSSHGVGWYINELDLRERDGDPTRDVLVPPIVLVEEGKHSSAIDRNGDGAWTPGYDANVFPSDAWGLRDTLRSSHFLALTYHEELTKKRTEESIVWPPNGRPSQWGLMGPNPTTSGDVLKYALRSATDDICKSIIRPETPVPAEIENLQHLVNWDEEMCDRERVMPAHTDSKAKSIINEKWSNFKNLAVQTPIGGVWRVRYFRRTEPAEWLTYRLDSGGGGFAVITPLGVSLPIGWVVGKVDYVRRNDPAVPNHEISRLSFDAMYTPSASRGVDWYVSGGQEKVGPGWSGALEGGLRFRWAVGDIPKLGDAIHSHWVLRYLMGARIGIRTNFTGNVPGFQSTRFVFEAGGGSW
jgi:hypothetical protein